jgi:hypothetical protein
MDYTLDECFHFWHRHGYFSLLSVCPDRLWVLANLLADGYGEGAFAVVVT